MKDGTLYPRVTNDLLRFGNQERDGGYVIPENVILRTNSIITLGVGPEWTFEVDMSRRSEIRSIDTYDGSVSRFTFLRRCLDHLLKVPGQMLMLDFKNARTSIRRSIQRLRKHMAFGRFLANEKIRHHVLFVGSTTADGYISLEDILWDHVSGTEAGQHSLFLKMDIENAEWPLLGSLQRHAELFSGIAIEFHKLDDPAHVRKLEAFMKGMRDQDFEVVFVAPNNGSGMSPLMPGISNTLEITLAYRPYCDFSDLDYGSFTHLIRRNDPYMSEIRLFN